MFNSINLQLFADGGGEVVNATVGYVNAYTGDTTAFSGNDTLDPTLKTFYDTELLENARVEMYYAQFAKTQSLPANHGKRVEWRKWNTFPPAKKLEEAVIPQGEKFGMTSKYGAINQFGLYTAISDVLELHAYDDTILGATVEMGASAAESQERLIRDALYTNPNVVYCDNITLETGAVASTPTSLDTMEGSATVCSILTSTMVNKVATMLRKDRVPTIGGKYVAVIHPSVAIDLRESKGWLEAHKYAAPDEIFNGEIGELHGVRFIENPFAPVYKGDDLASDARSLAVNGAVTASTTVTFDGGTVAADALVGQYVNIDGQRRQVVANTATTMTLDETVTAADNATILPDGNKAGGAVYATYFFGKDAFGIIDPEGGALEMIVKPKEQAGGPLNQFSTIGYKFETNGATPLYTERMIRVMSGSSFFGTTDETN